MINRIRMFFGAGWAQPVSHHGWAGVASFLEIIKRASGYRVVVRPAHRAWERACGIA